MSDKIAIARKAFQAILDAEDDFRDAFVDAYPLGAHAYYDHGRGSVGCCVTKHLYGYVQVISDNSGKEYQIRNERLLP